MPTILQPPFGAGDPQAQTRRALALLESRVEMLERQLGKVSVQAGAPGAGPAPDGMLAGDSTNNRIWLRVNGVWKYTALT